jgi:hypothetical protein
VSHCEPTAHVPGAIHREIRNSLFLRHFAVPLLAIPCLKFPTTQPVQETYSCIELKVLY